MRRAHAVMFRPLLCVVGVVACLPASVALFAQEDRAKAYLLHVSKREIPSDTGTEATTVSVEEHAELGGKALKVVLADSFGVKKDQVRNWSPFEELAFSAFNPGAQAVKVNLTVRHKKSTN